MQHKRIATLAFQRINNLRVTGRTQGHGTDGLRFTTGEQGATVHLGQHVDFTGDWTHSAVVAAINTRLTGQDALAHQVLLYSS